MQEPSMPAEGGCQCGGVRYRVSSPPKRHYVCHCRECRKQSSSAFGISVIVERDAFHLSRGEPKCWSRPTASGGRLDCWFCPDCGSRLWHENPEDPEISVKGGSFDDDIDLTGRPHIWACRKLPGVVIPEGSPCHQREPEGQSETDS